MKRTGSVVAAVASSATVVAGAISYSDPMPDYTSQQHQVRKLVCDAIVWVFFFIIFFVD